ncbi:MAG: ABC transporter permease [Xenococcaceae cyanobacterium]
MSSSATITPTNSPWGQFVQETFALTRRLFIQLKRRPSTLIAGIIQPLMWLILFGALFQNAPEGLFGESQNSVQFLSAGVIVFTAFSGALHGGLAVMFDREFGFLNRLLVAPLVSRFSIVLASAIYIVTGSLLQTAVIVVTSAFLGAGLPQIAGLGTIALVVFLLVLGVTSLSLGLAFALPGHIQMIAVIFVINLPILFASTALAPLSYMAKWLSYIASINPLSYTIEMIRYLYLHSDWGLSSAIMEAPWGDVTFAGALLVLLGFDVVAVLSIQPLLRRRIRLI